MGKSHPHALTSQKERKKSGKVKSRHRHVQKCIEQSAADPKKRKRKKKGKVKRESYDKRREVNHTEIAFIEWMLQRGSKTLIHELWNQYNDDWDSIPEDSMPPNTHRPPNLYSQWNKARTKKTEMWALVRKGRAKLKHILSEKESMLNYVKKLEKTKKRRKKEVEASKKGKPDSKVMASLSDNGNDSDDGDHTDVGAQEVTWADQDKDTAKAEGNDNEKKRNKKRKKKHSSDASRSSGGKSGSNFNAFALLDELEDGEDPVQHNAYWN